MFGSRPRPRRPMLLLLVFGILIAIVGVTATAQAIMVGAYASTSTLDAFVQSDLATIRGFVSTGVDASIVDSAPTADQQARMDGLLSTLTSKGQILRVELRRPDGSILAASVPGLAGQPLAPDADFQSAVSSAGAQVSLQPAASADAGPGDIGTTTVMREYLPISVANQVVLVVSVWRDGVPILGELDGLRTDVVLVTLTAALIAAATLYLVFRSAQGRLARQAEALVEASRRDGLTGALNHGTVVGLLAEEIERVRTVGSGVSVALIDVDGFRALNDTHGHAAGDEALLAVSRLLAATLPATATLGRYGPDEFLVVAPETAGADLQAVVEELRASLLEVSLAFEPTQRLPITVSGGIATYPDHGSSVSSLLSTVVQTLEEAKAGGGDAVRLARREAPGDASLSSGFDVLKGLVIAVDTKDRYTKRHSEDVSRYALFLANRMGLGDEFLRTVRTAGLLHDVGKIGIPDEILRKPGRLTAAEMAVLQQHVALGDMIVRELPDVETVRDAVRHHHERWDGKGYLAGLAGDDIPLVARIVAVGDAFSAMTTTRPYRRAIPIREALTRLGDAAGSQLEERLVAIFIEGLETDHDAPLPGIELSSATLWTPLRQAA